MPPKTIQASAVLRRLKQRLLMPRNAAGLRPFYPWRYLAYPSWPSLDCRSRWSKSSRATGRSLNCPCNAPPQMIVMPRCHALPHLTPPRCSRDAQRVLTHHRPDFSGRSHRWLYGKSYGKRRRRRDRSHGPPEHPAPSTAAATPTALLSPTTSLLPTPAGLLSAAAGLLPTPTPTPRLLVQRCLVSLRPRTALSRSIPRPSSCGR